MLAEDPLKEDNKVNKRKKMTLSHDTYQAKRSCSISREDPFFCNQREKPAKAQNYSHMEVAEKSERRIGRERMILVSVANREQQLQQRSLLATFLPAPLFSSLLSRFSSVPVSSLIRSHLPFWLRVHTAYLSSLLLLIALRGSSIIY